MFIPPSSLSDKWMFSKRFCLENCINMICFSFTGSVTPPMLCMQSSASTTTSVRTLCHWGAVAQNNKTATPQWHSLPLKIKRQSQCEDLFCTIPFITKLIFTSCSSEIVWTLAQEKEKVKGYTLKALFLQEHCSSLVWHDYIYLLQSNKYIFMSLQSWFKEISL